MHEAKARFVTINRFGVLVSEEVSISRAGDDESSLLIDQEVGLAMQAVLMRKIGNSITDDPIPLKFYHKFLYFAHGMACSRLTYCLLLWY